MLSHTVREERRKSNERCICCYAESDAGFAGTILNESASGILLETAESLEKGKRIWVLSLPGEDPMTLNISPEDLINHPLSRAGMVVREVKNNQVGIQFDQVEGERPKYLRYFRGKSTVFSLIDGDRATIAMSGALNFETVVLLERILTKQSQPLREVLLTCHNIDYIQGTALTVLRTSLRQCDKNGMALTIVTGPDTATAFEKNLSLTHGFILNINDISAIAESPPTASLQIQSDVPDGVAILARGISELNRLSNPLERQGITYWRTQNFKEGPELIAEHNPRFVVIEVEIEHCPMLIDINRLRNFPLTHIPPALVIGPPHLKELIREALVLPVKIYLTKPCTDREYASGLQGMLQQDYSINK